MCAKVQPALQTIADEPVVHHDLSLGLKQCKGHLLASRYGVAPQQRLKWGPLTLSAPAPAPSSVQRETGLPNRQHPTFTVSSTFKSQATMDKVDTSVATDDQPKDVVDTTPISPSRARLERRNSLEKYLQQRPEAQDLKNRHILLDTTAAP